MIGHELNGFPVVLNDHMVVRKWVFPHDPFVAYGPEDESWARLCWPQFGHEVAEPDPNMLRVGDTFYAHPETFHRLADAAARVQKKEDDKFCEAINATGGQFPATGTPGGYTVGGITADMIRDCLKLLPATSSRRVNLERDLFSRPLPMTMKPVEFNWLDDEEKKWEKQRFQRLSFLLNTVI